MIHIYLLYWRGYSFGYIVHLIDAIGVLAYANPKRFMYIVVNVIQMMSKGDPMLPPYALT